jgi:hypothetical protein
MNPALTIAILICIVAGFIHGGQLMNNVKKDPRLGVKPSKNLFTFLFIDL